MLGGMYVYNFVVEEYRSITCPIYQRFFELYGFQDLFRWKRDVWGTIYLYVSFEGEQ